MEYYVIESQNNDNYPLLQWDQNSSQFSKGLPVNDDEPIKFILGDPVPDSPEMVDYHCAPEPVVSDIIHDVLKPLDLKGIQFLPAKVKTGQTIYDYWYFHIFNEIECMDSDLSEVTITRRGKIIGIDKLVLDENILSDIQEKDRLIFKLKENRGIILCHKSVYDKLNTLAPKGIAFYKVQEWNDNVKFI